jgi:hypothetical protein
VRPILNHASVVPPSLLVARHDLEYDTTAIVTRDPADLRFRIPKPGRYSVSVSAYDASGLGATQRTDGFEIVAASGTCQNIAGEPLHVGDRVMGFSGQCLDFGGKHRRFWTTHDIDLNGVGLRPDPGTALYLALDGAGDQRLLATTSRKPGDFQGDGPLADGEADGLAAHPGGVSVVVDGEAVARFSSFSGAKALAFIANDHGAQPTIPSGATYHGSPLARPGSGGADFDAFSVLFEPGGRSGTTTTHFRIVLPSQFSRDDAGTSPTADVTRPGVDEPRSTTLDTNTYADIARNRHRAAARAHAALNLAGTLDLSGTTVGPVSIQDGELEFDPARGLWRGDIRKATLTLGPKIISVKFHILIDGGALKEAGGEASDQTGIVIFAGVTLNTVRFSIVTDPLTISGGAGFKFLNVLTGDLDLTVRVDPVFLRLEGRVGLAGLELGGGFVQYDEANAKTLTFGGHFGANFGPASLKADLQGGISFGTKEFYIQGSGHACLWICLDVQALASNIAVAGCGSIDLFIGKIAAGLAYRFGEGLDVFSGCDLEPYKPAVFRTRAGPSLPGALTVAPGTESVAFRFYGDPNLPGAPKLSLSAPDGRVFTTAPAPGDYAFAPPEPPGLGGRPGGVVQSATALIDQDPVDHVSTVLVARPAAGDWHVEPAPGQPAPVRVEQSVGRHVPDKALQADVASATVSARRLTIGRTRFAVGARASATRVTPTAVAQLRRLPGIERSRLRGVVLDVPTGLTGTLVLTDVGPHSTTVVRKLDVAASNGKVPVAFEPGGEPGAHELRAFLAYPDGTPRQSIVVDRFTAPPIPTPSAPRIVARRQRSGITVVDVDPGTAGSPSSAAASFDIVVVTSSGQRIERIVDGSAARALPDGRFRVTLGRIGGRTVKISARMRYAGITGVARQDVLRNRS